MTAYVRRQTYIVIIIINNYFPFTEWVARLKGQGGGKIQIQRSRKYKGQGRYPLQNGQSHIHSPFQIHRVIAPMTKAGSNNLGE